MSGTDGYRKHEWVAHAIPNPTCQKAYDKAVGETRAYVRDVIDPHNYPDDEDKARLWHYTKLGYFAELAFGGYFEGEDYDPEYLSPLERKYLKETGPRESFTLINTREAILERVRKKYPRKAKKESKDIDYA